MDLPECHSRRLVDGEPGVYFCAHPAMHARDNLVNAGICRACTYWRLPPPSRFRPFPPAGPLRRRGPCAHLGGQVGLRACRSCRGSVQLKVFACRHPAHGETTLPECGRCRDFTAAPPAP
jgi:hypothetical protein